MPHALFQIGALSLFAFVAGIEPVSARQAAVSGTAQQAMDRATAAPLMREGGTLLAQHVSELEARLQAAPDDMPARARLLGYYFNAARARAEPGVILPARRRHVLWVIEHYPGSDITRMSELTIDPAGHPLADEVGYGEARKLWLDHIARRQGDITVLSNAAWFFRLSDKELAINSLKQAMQLAPDNREMAVALGYMYGLTALGITMMNQNGLPTAWDAAFASGEFATPAVKEVRESSNRNVIASAGGFLARYGGMISAASGGAINRDALAEELLTRAAEMDPADVGVAAALTQFYRMRLIAATDPAERAALAHKRLEQAEMIVARATGNQSAQLAALIDVSKAALDAGAFDRAQRYATDLLKRLSSPPTVEEGPAFHDAHVVLGRVALHEGDLAQARTYLLQAGQTPGGGTLTSFGPNMSLAKELADRGELATVITYLQSCRSFWKRPQLETWIQSLEDGKVPNFGANLIY